MKLSLLLLAVALTWRTSSALSLRKPTPLLLKKATPTTIDDGQTGTDHADHADHAPKHEHAHRRLRMDEGAKIGIYCGTVFILSLFRQCLQGRRAAQAGNAQGRAQQDGAGCCRPRVKVFMFLLAAVVPVVFLGFAMEVFGHWGHYHSEDEETTWWIVSGIWLVVMAMLACYLRRRGFFSVQAADARQAAGIAHRPQNATCGDFWKGFCCPKPGCCPGVSLKVKDNFEETLPAGVIVITYLQAFCLVGGYAFFFIGDYRVPDGTFLSFAVGLAVVFIGNYEMWLGAKKRRKCTLICCCVWNVLQVANALFGIYSSVLWYPSRDEIPFQWCAGNSRYSPCMDLLHLFDALSGFDSGNFWLTLLFISNIANTIFTLWLAVLAGLAAAKVSKKSTAAAVTPFTVTMSGAP